MTSYSEVKVANNARASLAGGISANQGSLSLIGGEGAKFPTLNTGEYFYITVTSSALATNTEIMRVTARSADTFTITRPDGTARNSNNTFSAGDSVELRITENALTDLFDLDILLPSIPPDTDPSRQRFSFYRPPVGHTLIRYLGRYGQLDGTHSENEKHRSFALKSDGTNTTYQPLNPSDISDDNNTNTSFISLPVRAHPYMAHVRGNEMYEREFTTINFPSGPYVGSWVEQNQSTNGNLYLMGEGHDMPIQAGSLVYLDNVADVVDASTASGPQPSTSSYQTTSYGENFIAYTTSNTVGANIITFNDIKIHYDTTGGRYFPPHSPYPLGASPDQDWNAFVYVGAYLFPPAVPAGYVNIPTGTYITECTVSGSGNTYSVSATLNNNVILPATYRVQFYKNRFLQLGKHYSASTKSTVYYKRDDLAPSPQTVNSDTNITNVNQGSYLPVSGNIGNVYICTANTPHSNGGASASGRISSTQYYFQYETNQSNGDFPTQAGGDFGITVKPVSTNSVFTIKLYTGCYKDTGNKYGAIAFYCDYIENDPQPLSTRNFKNTGDLDTAKAVVLIGRHMHIDRFLQPEFNGNFTRKSNTSNEGYYYSFSTGQVTPGTWPNDPGNTIISQQTMTQTASVDYVTHVDGTAVGAIAENQYFAGHWNHLVHVTSTQTAVQYFRPGVTDKVRFRLQFYREDNSGTTYLNFLDGHTACLVVEEHIHPYGSFGFDIPGGLDTTAHWNGNIVDA